MSAQTILRPRLPRRRYENVSFCSGEHDSTEQQIVSYTKFTTGQYRHEVQDNFCFFSIDTEANRL